MVNLEDLPGPNALACAYRKDGGGLGVIANERSEVRGLDAFGEMSRAGRKDVATVKGVAQRRQKKFAGGDGADFVLGLCSVNDGEGTVVGADEILPGGFYQNRSARGANAGVHYNDMDGSPGKKRIGLRNHEAAFENFERRDLMAEVDDTHPGRDAEDDAFHGSDKMVGESEIGSEGDYGHG